VRALVRKERGTRRASGIEGGVSQRARDQGTHGDGQADAEAGDGFESASFVDGGSKNDQHEKEGGHSFEGHAGSNRKVARQFGSAEGNSAPGVIGNGGLEDEGRNDSDDTWRAVALSTRSEEHTSELQSHLNLVCRLL